MDLRQPICKLLDLPLELLLLICEFLNESSIYRFSRVNRHLNEQLDGEWFFDRSTLRPANSALMFAAEHNHLRAVRRAISEGADVNTDHPIGKYTPLIVATECGHTDIVSCLLGQPGIKINASDRSGHTALHSASQWGHTDIVRCLLDQPGIEVNALYKNQTALQLAYQYEHAEIVEILNRFSNLQVKCGESL